MRTNKNKFAIGNDVTIFSQRVQGCIFTYSFILADNEYTYLVRDSAGILHKVLESNLVANNDTPSKGLQL